MEKFIRVSLLCECQSKVAMQASQNFLFLTFSVSCSSSSLFSLPRLFWGSKVTTIRRILCTTAEGEKRLQEATPHRPDDDYIMNLHFIETLCYASFLPVLFLSRGFSNSEEAMTFTNMLLMLSSEGLAVLPFLISLLESRFSIDILIK